MRRIIISESERKDILKKHSSLILEEQELTAGQKLEKIQLALGTSGDKVIGPDTTKKIVDALKSAPKKTDKDFDCVVYIKNDDSYKILDQNQIHKAKVIDKPGDESDIWDIIKIKEEYQIGDFIFEPYGVYYISSDPKSKFTWNCNGTTIQTSNHGNFEKVTPEVSSDGEKKDETASDKHEEKTDLSIVNNMNFQ